MIYSSLDSSLVYARCQHVLPTSYLWQVCSWNSWFTWTLWPLALQVQISTDPSGCPAMWDSPQPGQKRSRLPTKAHGSAPLAWCSYHIQWYDKDLAGVTNIPALQPTWHEDAIQQDLGRGRSAVLTSSVLPRRPTFLWTGPWKLAWVDKQGTAGNGRKGCLWWSLTHHVVYRTH